MAETHVPRELEPLEQIEAIGKLAGYLARAHKANDKAARLIKDSAGYLQTAISDLARLLAEAYTEIAEDPEDPYCTCCWADPRSRRCQGQVPRSVCQGSRGECID
jgi:hypothetical protein